MKHFKLKFKNSEGAVANVIGAILLTGVFSIVMTTITVYYVPIWIENTEAKHMSGVANELNQFKTTLDLQVEKADTNTTMQSPFELGDSGIAFFDASKTTGRLSLNRFDNYLNMKNSTGILNITSYGSLTFSSLNRYYTQQTYSYEFGACVLNQTDGGRITAAPQIMIRNTSGGIQAAVTFVSLSAAASELAGTGTANVGTRLSVMWSYSYSWTSSENLTFAINSNAGASAWKSWFSGQLNASQNGLAYGTDFTLNQSGQVVWVSISNVKALSVRFAVVEAAVQAG